MGLKIDSTRKITLNVFNIYNQCKINSYDFIKLTWRKMWRQRISK